MRIAVIGLGKLGCPMAALLAAAGNDVVGADLNRGCVELVNAGRAPVLEPGLEELMVAAAPRLRATTSVEEAVADAEIAFCIVPTPSLPDSSFDTSYAEGAFEAIGRGWRSDNGGRRVAVLTSTVLPGATEARVKPALERGIGYPVGDRLGLCYSPEFIALGTVIDNMRHPDMILMGASAGWAAEIALSAITSIADQKSPVAAMSIVDAEVTKIAVNTFITTKISYGNMIGELCERLPGADAMVVTAALGLDSRIGRKYIQPAAPYGGPCFPRDNAAFAGLARSLGFEADIAVATDAVNRRQAAWLISRLHSQVAVRNRVAVLGLSYKPFTPVVEEAFGLLVANELAATGYEVAAYDPLGHVYAKSAAGPGVELVESVAAAADGARAVVVATPWPEFREIASLPGVELLFDYWRIVPLAALDPATVVSYPGMNPRPAGELA